MWTEEEAAKLWCPLARYDKNNRGVDGAPIKEARCIASGCMSWRWQLTKEPLAPDARKSAGMAFGLAYALQPTTYERGFCGAFGAPSGRPDILIAAERGGAA